MNHLVPRPESQKHVPCLLIHVHVQVAPQRPAAVHIGGEDRMQDPHHLTNAHTRIMFGTKDAVGLRKRGGIRDSLNNGAVHQKLGLLRKATVLEDWGHPVVSPPCAARAQKHHIPKPPHNSRILRDGAESPRLLILESNRTAPWTIMDVKDGR